MKRVYVVIAETEYDVPYYDKVIIDIYENEYDAINRTQSIMQDIEAYVNTFPKDTGIEDADMEAWQLWKQNYPHKIGDELIDSVYLIAREVL